MKFANFRNFRCTLSSYWEPQAVCGSQITEPYSRIGHTKEQYNVLIEHLNVNSLVNFITNPRTFNAVQ